MPRRPLSDIRDELVEQFERVLEDYIKGMGEFALKSAYDLGHRGLAHGLGVLEMAELHHPALLRLLLRAATQEEVLRRVKSSAELFAESLAPFEMAHRGFRESNATLRRVNEMLEQEARRIAHALHSEATQLLAPVHIAVSEL